ncbi:MAG: hypothetical protein O2782_18920 [bacterium]|nr:hypothetical protein [bacterium]
MEARLARMIKNLGADASLVGHYRNQIAAAKTGQSAQEMYITGMIKKAPSQ